METVSLGNRLVEELSLVGNVDTLARWMSHYLAQLLNALDSEKRSSKRTVLQKKCFAIIERLWTRRAMLPDGAKPLGRIDEALTALIAVRADHTRTPHMIHRASAEIQNPWIKFAQESYSADHRMFSIAFLTGVLENEFGFEQSWLKNHQSKLSKSEQKLIRLLDDWLASKINWFVTLDSQKTITSFPPKDRNALVLAELEKSVQLQVEAVGRLKKALAVREGEAH